MAASFTAASFVIVGGSGLFWAIITLAFSASLGLAVGVYKTCKDMFKPPPNSHSRHKVPAEELSAILRDAENITLSAESIRERVIRQEQLLQVREEVRQQREEECSEGGSRSTHTRRE